MAVPAAAFQITLPTAGRVQAAEGREGVEGAGVEWYRRKLEQELEKETRSWRVWWWF